MKFNKKDLRYQVLMDFRLPEIVLYKKINDKHKLWFYSDLYLLFSSNLDIKTTFEILEEQAEQSWIKQAIKNAKHEIIAGSSIADALKKSRLGENYEYYALQIGENTGKTNQVLKEIKLFYERKIKQQRQVKSALTYPLLVLFTAVGAVSFMLSVIVPMFEEIFHRFQGNLPTLTKKIIDISAWIKGNYIFLLVLMLFIIMVTRKISCYDWFKAFRDKILLKLPFIGRVVYTIQCARFCHNMALLTGAHSPLVQSLNLTQKMTGFTPLKKAISEVSNRIITGSSLYISFETCGFFEKKFTALIKAAEEVNKLEYAFDQLVKQYNEEADYKLGIMGNFLEPLLIIMVGGLVAVILIAMYLPLFQIGTTIY